MLAAVSHILPLTHIRRERLLPLPGRILVRKGQKVAATDPIGEYKPRQDYYLVDVARVLGISADHVDRYIQCETGSAIAEGDVIAGPVGFTKRVIRTPRSGKVILTGGGQVLLELDEQLVSVLAGVSGEITELISDRGVVVETTGSLVQGVWGNGKIDFGPLRILAKSPDHELSEEQLDASQRGAVILAGYCKDAHILEVAHQVQIRGLILGSIDFSIKKMAQELSYPIILLEGFGKFPINASAFRLLTSQEQKEISLNAETTNHLAGVRPEIIVPVPTSGTVAQPKTTEYFAPQQKIRILNSLYARSTGILTQIKGWVVMPSGIRAHAAEVILDQNNERVIVPLDNLEILA